MYEAKMVRHTLQREQSGGRGNNIQNMNGCGRDDGMKARRQGKWKKRRKQKKRRKEDRKRKRKKRGCKVWMLWMWCKKSTKRNTDRGKRRDKGEKEEKKRREKRGWNPGRMGRFFFLLISMVMQKCWRG